MNQLPNNVQSGLTIGIPTLGRPVTLEWAQAYKSLVPPINFNTVTVFVRGKPVDIARNEIVAAALEANHKYLYFMGDDTIPPHNILKKLIFRAEHNKDHGIITGVYCSKSDPPAPLLFRGNGSGSYWDWKTGEYFQITGCGMDACLLRLDVFRELIDKGIVDQKDRQGNWQFYKTVEEDGFDAGLNAAQMWTEDLYFLRKVEETDWKVYCDGEQICDHVDVYTGKIYTLPANSYPVTGVKDLRESVKKRAVNLGFGGYHINFGDEYKTITVDIRDETKPDYRADVRELPFGDNYFDLVFSSHVLEHLSREDYKIALKEWTRILKPDGELRTIVPNIEWAVEQFKEGKALDPQIKPHVWNVLYGGQSNPFDFHYNGWTEQTLQVELRKFGYKYFEVQKDNGYNLLVRAWLQKPEEKKNGSKRKRVKRSK